MSGVICGRSSRMSVNKRKRLHACIGTSYSVWTRDRGNDRKVLRFSLGVTRMEGGKKSAHKGDSTGETFY